MAAQVGDVYLRMRCCCGNERCDGDSCESSGHEGHCGAFVQAAADDLSPKHLLIPKRGASACGLVVATNTLQLKTGSKEPTDSHKLLWSTLRNCTTEAYIGPQRASYRVKVPVCRTGVALPKSSPRALQEDCKVVCSHGHVTGQDDERKAI